MGKIWRLVWQKEIPQIMAVAFMCSMLAINLGVIACPFVWPEFKQSVYYAEPETLLTWFFILGIPGIIAVTVGIVMTIIAVMRARNDWYPLYPKRRR